MNFSHSLQGLLGIGLGFNHGLQFQGRHFWQSGKITLHYIFSRKNLLREEQMRLYHWCGSWSQTYKWTEVCWSHRVLSDLIDQCLICLCGFFLHLQWQSQHDFCSRVCSKKLSEGEERELKQGTGAWRPCGNRETTVRNSEQVSQTWDCGKSLPAKKRRQCLLPPGKVMSWLKWSQEVRYVWKDAVNMSILLIMLFIVLHRHFNISLF